MSPRGGESASVWMRADVPRFPKLGQDLRADVCIVGAGIAGLTTALLLSGERRSIVVLDDGPIGGGETGRTTAHLASVLDDDFQEIERLHGSIPIPEDYITNTAFGGPDMKTLYVTAGKTLYRLKNDIAGLPR